MEAWQQVNNLLPNRGYPCIDCTREYREMMFKEGRCRHWNDIVCDDPNEGGFIVRRNKMIPRYVGRMGRAYDRAFEKDLISETE